MEQKQHLSGRALDVLRGNEYLRLWPYDDAVRLDKQRPLMKNDSVSGTVTIGYGHTRTALDYLGKTISLSDAERLLAEDVWEAEQIVRSLVFVPLKQGEFDALVLFAFNLGGKNLLKSTLLARLNRGFYSEVPTELLKWCRATVKDKSGKKIRITMPGLLKRRQDEVALWNS